jgi:O-antigen/teichoic acid export membrane protein
MGIIQSQSIKGTLYSYIGVLLGFVTTGLLYPFVLEPEQIGVTKLLLSYSTLATQLASLGFNGVAVRLFPYFRDKKTAHKGFLYLGLLISAIGLLITFVGLFLMQPWIISKSIEKSALFTEYFSWIYLLIITQLIFSTLDNYFTQLFNSTYAIIHKEFVQRILLIIITLLFWFDWINFSQYIMLFVIAVSIPTLLLTYNIYKAGELRINPTLKYIDKDLMNQVVKVSLISIFTSVTSVIILNIDSIMLSTIAGVAATGIYTINYFFAILISVPNRPMVKIANAVIADSWMKNDLNNIRDIYKKSTLSQMVAGSFLLLGLFINIDSIYQYLPKNYETGKYVLIFIGISSWMEMATGVSKSVIGSSKYYYVQSIAMVGLALMVIGTNYLFIPKYGLSGAAFASFLSLFSFISFRYFFIWYKFKMQPFDIKSLYITLLMLVLLYLSQFLPMTNRYYVDIPYKSAIVSIVYIGIIYLSKVSPEINTVADSVLKVIFRRNHE